MRLDQGKTNVISMLQKKRSVMEGFTTKSKEQKEAEETRFASEEDET